jgi:hypothetical protein
VEVLPRGWHCVDLKERQPDQVEGVVNGAEDKLEGATNLKERELERVTNTLEGVVGGVEGQVEGATTNLKERQLPIGRLETILKGLFAKIQSGRWTGALSKRAVTDTALPGALTPEMVLGALNPSGVQSLLGGVLGGGALGHLETIIKGVFSKVQSGELTGALSKRAVTDTALAGALTPEMVLGALNPAILQSLLSGVLGGVLGNLL